LSEVKSAFRQTDEPEEIAGEYFESVYKKYRGNPGVEVQDFENKNARVTLLKVDNRTKAFVIETRTEYNNIEYVYGSLDL